VQCLPGTPGKNRQWVSVLLDVPAKPYDDEGLARLLRLLRPPPEGWVRKAQRIPLDMSVLERPVAEETLTDGDLAELGRKLEIDSFRRRFDADPVAAAEAAGMHGLALGLEREIRELVGIAERIANDDAYRAELVRDPVAALVGAGIPAATAEPLLQALAVPDEVLASLPEIVAHQHEQLPLKARLLILLLGSSAVAEQIRSPKPGA
jgi:putative modified peptide